VSGYYWNILFVLVCVAVRVGPCVGLLMEHSVCVGLCSSYSWPLRRVNTGTFCLCWFVQQLQLAPASGYYRNILFVLVCVAVTAALCRVTTGTFCLCWFVQQSQLAAVSGYYWSILFVLVCVAVTAGPCVGLLPEHSVCVGLCSSYSWPLCRVTTGTFCLCWFVQQLQLAPASGYYWNILFVLVCVAVTVGPCVGLLPEHSVCVGLCSSYSWSLRRVTTGTFCLCWFVLWPLGVAALVA
jgi:hypothetical protein